MSGLSVRFRAFALVLAGVGGLGLTKAPAVGHRLEVGPRPGGPLAADVLSRDSLLIGTVSRAQAPVRLTWPAPGAETGWFGELRAGHVHPGTDIDGETGDPIYAAGKGAVVWAGAAPAGYAGYGTIVEIDHGQGVHTLYAHLSRTNVAVGDYVPAGVLIGAIGTSGNVTGSHLHFEVRVAGKQVDPEDWLPPRQAAVTTATTTAAPSTTVPRTSSTVAKPSSPAPLGRGTVTGTRSHPHAG
jgi:murein DD-endopeptidase MepM/ murein hydrolase activator NlpD